MDGLFFLFYLVKTYGIILLICGIIGIFLTYVLNRPKEWYNYFITVTLCGTLMYLIMIWGIDKCLIIS